MTESKEKLIEIAQILNPAWSRDYLVDCNDVSLIDKIHDYFKKGRGGEQ